MSGRLLGRGGAFAFAVAMIASEGGTAWVWWSDYCLSFLPYCKVRTRVGLLVASIARYTDVNLLIQKGLEYRRLLQPCLLAYVSVKLYTF